MAGKYKVPWERLDALPKHSAVFIARRSLPAGHSPNINTIRDTYLARKATPPTRRVTWHTVKGGYLFVRLA